MSVYSRRSKTSPAWAVFSVATNVILMVVVAVLLVQKHGITVFISAIANENKLNPTTKTPAATPQLGLRHQLNYDEWVAILKQEANVAAENHQENLTVLAGDSLSLWFPSDLLPPDRTWLNQGISGETSAGLLQRLDLFDSTQPETIFVMIGINDLIREVSDDTILANHRSIIRRLRRVHPQAQIVVQSILPHSDNAATWEGRDRLLAIPNSRIRQLNEEIKAIARNQNVKFLDLHPLFTDSQGNLRPQLTSDGLHLSQQGYLVWRSALQMYTQLELEPKFSNSAG